MLSALNVYLQNETYKVYPHPANQVEDKEPMKVLVSGASCKSAVSLTLSIVKGVAFGSQQPVELILFDLPGPRYKYVIALASQLSISGYRLIKDVIPTNSTKDTFKDVDVAILLNPERTDVPGRNKVNYYFHLYKNLGCAINKQAKKNVRVAIAGEMTAECAMIFSQYANNIPSENITGVSRHTATRAYNIISANTQPKYKNVCGVHVWGLNRTDINNATVEEMKDGAIPETRMKTVNGQTVEMYTAVHDGVPQQIRLTEGLQNVKWTKYAISEEKGFYNQKSNDNWIGTSISQHFKDWFNGTDRPVSMIVCSDGSHNIPAGMFMSFPVTINHNKKWKIIKKFEIEMRTREQLKHDVKYLNLIKTQILTYACREDLKHIIENHLETQTGNQA